MSRAFNVLALGGAVLLLILFFPTASAQTPEAVEALVAEITYRELYGGNLDVFDADITLNWRLSPNDPDQVNGDWGYRILSGEGTEPNIWTPVATPTPIPARSGWVRAVFQVSGSGVGDFNLSIVANNTALEPADSASSNPSCVVRIDAREGHTVIPPNSQLDTIPHDQCGTNIEAPSGLNAVVVNECCGAGDDYGANTTARWRVSADDPDQTNGTFHYWVYSGQTVETMANRTDVTVAVDSTGIKKATLEDFTSPGGTYPQWIKVLARDNATFQRSEFSCVVFVQGGALYERAHCGTLGAPGGAFSEDGGISFPLADVTALAEASELPEWMVGALLGVFFVFGLAGLMFVKTGPVGGFVAGILGTAFVAVVGIMPMWFLVILFLGGVGVTVLFLTRGGE